MRREFVKALEELYLSYPFILLTGDVGFNAFEGLQAKMGERFINAGVAEQNMVSVAAGLALENEQVWVYSIAPFCYARPFEQVRNDICYHRLPVKLVGNGGGYAYGAMGYTHHALEDYGVLLTLNQMKIYIPAFDKDVSAIVSKLARGNHPSYLRLGKCELRNASLAPHYHPWRKLLSGAKSLLLAIGPLAGLYFDYFSRYIEEDRPELWVLTELPFEFSDIPDELLTAMRAKGVIVCEEHVAQGSAGQSLSYLLLSQAVHVPYFKHCYAKGYCSGNIGSQAFHRQESQLHPEAIERELLLFSTV